MKDGRSIGEVLTLLKDEYPDITISKIRFLESQGLLQPERTASGYRKFAAADVERLRWILTQQRDHFLPLKVIKERLESDELVFGTAAAEDDAEPAEAEHRTIDRDPGSPDLTREELMAGSGLSREQVSQLEKHGLIRGNGTGPQTLYRDGDLVIARVAAGFLEHGIEPRHLKAYKVAVDREAGLFEQRVAPLGRNQSLEVLGELVELGDELRLALLRGALRDRANR